jgi:membrane protease YdiL (CAAX protease family)
MERVARLFPFLATIVLGVAQAVAWRSSSGATTWLVLGVACAALLVMSLFLLRREELLAESFAVVPGDISRGIGGSAVAVMVTALCGFAAVRFAPTRAFEELRSLIFVATAVKVEWQRAFAIVALAACEEITFRGAVSAFLEERFGSARAPWVASGLYVLATVPSLRPSVILAAVVIGAVTAFLVARYRRLVIAIVAHAAFAWLAVEFVLPTLWQRLLQPR